MNAWILGLWNLIELMRQAQKITVTAEIRMIHATKRLEQDKMATFVLCVHCNSLKV